MTHTVTDVRYPLCNTSQPNLVVQVLVIGADCRATRQRKNTNRCFVWYAFSRLLRRASIYYKIIPNSHLGREIFLFGFEGARLILLVELLAKSQVGVTHQLTDE